MDYKIVKESDLVRMFSDLVITKSLIPSTPFEVLSLESGNRIKACISRVLGILKSHLESELFFVPDPDDSTHSKLVEFLRSSGEFFGVGTEKSDIFNTSDSQKHAFCPVSCLMGNKENCLYYETGACNCSAFKEKEH